MNIELIQEILLKLRSLPEGLGNESEAVWQRLLQELFELKGQACLEQIIWFLKPGASFQTVGQARWERFLARTMLSVKGLPFDIFKSMAVRYLEAGLYLAENRGAFLADDKAEEDFFSRLYEAKQFEVSYEDSKTKDKLEEIKALFPHAVKIIEVGEEKDVFCSEKKKIAFFVKTGMDSFLGDIINSLQDGYIVEKYIITEAKQIDEGMTWADICWFEWCDELVIYGSQLELAKRKKMICRLHSYEAFTEYPKQVKWEVIDQTIFVAEHIREFVLENVSALKEKQTVIIPNGIDLEKYTYKERKPGFNIAYVGYINYKKGPMLLLHAFKEIYDTDKRYKLYIAGEFQDPRDVLYFNQMASEWGIQENVIFQGWQDNLDKWLEDKNYILCTSILESQNLSVMQAMTKGIKPLIHNFVGARGIYPNTYIWTSIKELITLLKNTKYESAEYRKFVCDNYSMEKNFEAVRKTIVGKEDKRCVKPLVTIGVTVYNGAKFLKKCLDSLVTQIYENIEILVIDNASSDGSKEIIREYERKHANLRGIFHEENTGGPSEGIQEILAEGKGEYWQWMCCDDYYESNAVKEFVAYLEEHPELDYAYCDLNIVDEQGNMVNKWVYTVCSPDVVVQKIFECAAGIIPLNGMHRKKFFVENSIGWIREETSDFSTDVLNSLYYIKNGWKYGKIDCSVINYRVHSSNESHSIERRIKSAVTLLSYIVENFPKEIYLQGAGWKQVNNKEKALWYCLMAQHYLNLSYSYIVARNLPGHLRGSINQVLLRRFCQPYLREGMKYIQKAMQYPNARVNILQIKEAFENLFGLNEPQYKHAFSVVNYYDSLNINDYMLLNENAPIGDNLLRPFVELKKEANIKKIAIGTSDTMELDKAEAIVFVDMPMDTDPYFTQAKQMGKTMYLIALESLHVRPESFSIANHQAFKKVFTYRDDLLDGKKYFKINYSYSFPSLLVCDLASKTGFCVVIAGNKQARHFAESELYTERIKAIKWFEHHCPTQLDLYGTGWDSNVYPSYKGTVKNKKPILEKYKFSICYENVSDVPGYITEKLFDCFLAGCIPVYLGANNITDHIPPECFIDKRKFQTYDELYQYLSNLSDDEYINYINAIEMFLKSDKAYPFSIKYFVETLMNEINADLHWY